MPFRQLKSFLKILIGVQYERLHPPSPLPAAKLRQGPLSAHRPFSTGFVCALSKTELSVFIRVLLCKGVV